jgi:hypothetical protein
MNTQETGLFILWVSLLLAVLVAVTAVAGLFWAPTYAQEVPLWAAEAMGGDAVDLLVLVPVLLVSGLLAHRGSVPARLVWMGALLCLLYNLVIYTLAVHFNALFLVYCGVLGLSFYGILGSVTSLPFPEIARPYAERAPVKLVAVVFFLLASVTAVVELREIVPAILSGRAPQSVRDLGLLTNPIQVLDLSIALPGLVITAIMLLRRKAGALVLAPALLVALALMSMVLAGIGVAMLRKGFATGLPMVAFFIALAAGFVILLWVYFRSGRVRRNSAQQRIA